MKIIDDYEMHIKTAMMLWPTTSYQDNFLPGQLPGHINYYLLKRDKGRDTYERVSHLTNIPWEIIGTLHGLEAQFDFAKQIFNGEQWSEKTTLVPKGKGPWESWERSTVAALRSSAYSPQNWGVVESAYFFERWNGMGYFNRGLYSPYLWAYLSPYANQGGGKYVADGKFSETAISKQVGAMTQLIMDGFFWV